MVWSNTFYTRIRTFIFSPISRDLLTFSLLTWRFSEARSINQQQYRESLRSCTWNTVPENRTNAHSLDRFMTDRMVPEFFVLFASREKHRRTGCPGACRVARCPGWNIGELLRLNLCKISSRPDTDREKGEERRERERENRCSIFLQEIFRILGGASQPRISIFAMEIREWTLFAIPYVPFTLPGLVVWLAALIKFIPPLGLGLGIFVFTRPVLATD